MKPQHAVAVTAVPVRVPWYSTTTADCRYEYQGYNDRDKCTLNAAADDLSQSLVQRANRGDTVLSACLSALRSLLNDHLDRLKLLEVDLPLEEAPVVGRLEFGHEHDAKVGVAEDEIVRGAVAIRERGVYAEYAHVTIGRCCCAASGRVPSLACHSLVFEARLVHEPEQPRKEGVLELCVATEARL